MVTVRIVAAPERHHRIGVIGTGLLRVGLGQLALDDHGAGMIPVHHGAAVARLHVEIRRLDDARVMQLSVALEGRLQMPGHLRRTSLIISQPREVIHTSEDLVVVEDGEDHLRLPRVLAGGLEGTDAGLLDGPAELEESCVAGRYLPAVGLEQRPVVDDAVDVGRTGKIVELARHLASGESRPLIVPGHGLRREVEQGVRGDVAYRRHVGRDDDILGRPTQERLPQLVGGNAAAVQREHEIDLREALLESSLHGAVVDVVLGPHRDEHPILRHRIEGRHLVGRGSLGKPVIRLTVGARGYTASRTSSQHQGGRRRRGEPEERPARVIASHLPTPIPT